MGINLEDLTKTEIDNEYGTLYIAEIEDEMNVAVFTLNSEWRVINPGVIETLNKALDFVEGDDEIAGIVTYNEHGPYCNGFDLRLMGDLMELSETDWDAAEAQVSEIITAGQLVFDRLHTFSKPTVAAVGGWARGGGFEFALSHYYIMGADNTNVDDPMSPWFFKIQLPEVKQVGLVPGWNGIPLLMRRVISGKLAKKPDATPAQQEKTYRNVMKTLVEQVVIGAYGPDNASRAVKKHLIDEAVEREWTENNNNGALLEEAIYRTLDLADDYTPNTLEPLLLKPAPSQAIQDKMEDPELPPDYAYRCMYSMLKDESDTPIEEERDWQTVSSYSSSGIIELAKKPERRKLLTGYIGKALPFLDGLAENLKNRGVDLGWH